MARKARVNTERVYRNVLMPPGHPIILLKTNKFNMAVVSVKRSIRSGRSCAQVTGGREGNGKMYGGGGKTSPSHPTPLCPYLHPDDLWFPNHKMATAGNMERCFVRKIRQYVAGSHMTFDLSSRDFWLQARLTIYSPQSHSTSKNKDGGCKKNGKFFRPENTPACFRFREIRC